MFMKTQQWSVIERDPSKKTRAPFFNPMTLLDQDVLSFTSGHFYRFHQTSPEIVSGHPLCNSPMYSDIDSCAQSISAKSCIHS